VITEIRNGRQLLAIILSRDFSQPGIHFFTPDDWSQQLAFMRHPAGHLIAPHVHKPVPRTVQDTLEVLLLRRGSLRVDFYDEGQQYLESRVMQAGDAILLAAGGHGFEALEEIEMIEVKQGPYAGGKDKTRFTGTLPAQLNFGPIPHLK